MKKFLSLTLTLSILLTVIVVGIASASAQSFDTAIKIGGVTDVADIGDTFTYTVTLTSDKLLSAGQIEIPANFTVLKGDTEAALNDLLERGTEPDYLRKLPHPGSPVGKKRPRTTEE